MRKPKPAVARIRYSKRSHKWIVTMNSKKQYECREYESAKNFIIGWRNGEAKRGVI